jgi:Nif-specific regulatory protein
LDAGNLLFVENNMRQIEEIQLPPDYRSALHHIKAKYLVVKGGSKKNFEKAENECLSALHDADKNGPASLKPLIYLTLARIRKSLGYDNRPYISKAENLAAGFCLGLPENIQRIYLNKFKPAESVSVAVQEVIMEKTNREKRLETLFEVAQSINSILELDPLLNRVMDLMLENLSAERGFIMLKEIDGSVEPVVARNLDKENILGELTVSRSTIDDVFESGQPLIMNRTPEETTDRESVVNFHITSIMCAPLSVHDMVIGIVYIDNRLGGRAFDKTDLDFLQSFCHLAAIAIQNARLTARLSERNIYLQRQVEKASGFGNIIGRSSPMQKVFRMAEAVAATEATVVISGESGTGKEILARAIHFSGARKNGRFIPVDCGALPESLLESELFGHKKGSFTGAISDRPGLFEEADGGTIFLDEITNTSQNFQVKLLRVIQEGEFRRVGDVKTRRVDVRIVAATNKDLNAEVAAGNFRVDLYYRLNVVNIKLPALSERKEDIPILTEYFLDSICRKMKISKKAITSRTLDYLVNYRWPGNVRQLENVIERMTIFSKAELIDVVDLPQEIRSMFDDTPIDSKTQLNTPRTKVELKTAKAQLDRLFLTSVMEQSEGNVMLAAKLSGMDRTQLHHMLNKLNLDSTIFRKKS